MSSQNSTDGSINHDVATATDGYSENSSGCSQYFYREGKILKESENELVIKLNWNGKEFMGCLLGEKDENNPWAPPRKKSSNSQAEYKKLIAKQKKATAKAKQLPELSFREKYPQCFVDSANVIPTKFRYGRDSRVGVSSLGTLKSSVLEQSSSRTNIDSDQHDTEDDSLMSLEQKQKHSSPGKRRIRKQICKMSSMGSHSGDAKGDETTILDQNTSRPKTDGEKPFLERLTTDGDLDDTKDDSFMILEPKQNNSSPGKRRIRKQICENLSMVSHSGHAQDDKITILEAKQKKPKRRLKKSKYNNDTKGDEITILEEKKKKYNDDTKGDEITILEEKKKKYNDDTKGDEIMILKEKKKKLKYNDDTTEDETAILEEKKYNDDTNRDETTILEQKQKKPKKRRKKSKYSDNIKEDLIFYDAAE